MISQERIALVTGGSGGLGKAICQKLSKVNCLVILTSTSYKKALATIAELPKNIENEVVPAELDLTSEESIKKFFAFFKQNFSHLDILINNAGVFLDKGADKKSINFDSLNPEDFEKTLTINLMSPFRLIQFFLPEMKKRNYGRIVNVSSGMARFDDLDKFGPFYRISKLALNALTRIVADEVKGYNILINSVCPGWVKTAMGSPNAVRFPEEGSLGIVRAALLEDGGPSGCFFRDDKQLDWSKKS